MASGPFAWFPFIFKRRVLSDSGIMGTGGIEKVIFGLGSTKIGNYFLEIFSIFG
jgi:hypothetical protein